MPVYALGDQVPAIHPDAYVHPDAVVIGSVVIGAESSVWPAAVLRGDFGRIEVGERTSIQDGTVVHTTERWPTLIGGDCVVGHNAHLEGCTVEDRCLIGSGSVVLNRAVVRTESVVGAQALVPEGLEVPRGHLALGVPACLRPIDGTAHSDWIGYGVAEYLTNAKRYRHELRRLDG
ncbi:gamma carbonic anhydrase family protein [Nonomuraea rosea]|uniref:Gamma carbonic anhydrase family protein n=1 Tax=Nonomuraea rosea TaxID=638574 RepID=A0ABP6Z4Z7_9ACTN